MFPGVTTAAIALLCLAAAPAPAVTVRPPNEVEFTAIVHRARFERSLLGLGMPGYHAVVWKGGSAAGAGLFEADVSDTDVLDALERLRRPGPAIPIDAWEKRRDAKSRAPDTVIAGPAVDVLVRLPGRGSLAPLSELLVDPGGRGLDLRFGNNRANIAKWGSGCIVCLYSCPGSKVGNARYTLRDYENGVTSFRVRDGVLPADGTRVGIVLRLKPQGSPPG